MTISKRLVRNESVDTQIVNKLVRNESEDECKQVLARKGVMAE